MYVVGIAQLATTVDVETPLLAADLGLTPYEARMYLLPGLPAVALLTQEKSKALELLAKLRGRGHDAIAFDGSAVVASQEMCGIRRFRFDDDALVTENPQLHTLPYASVLATLRATHHTRTELTTEEKTRKFSAGSALLTGGLVMTKTTKTASTTRREDRQEVMYVFRNDNEPPWLLRESGPKYEGLHERMASTEHANFLTTVTMLRERTPHAIVDDRLLNRKVPERIAQVAVQSLARGKTVESSSEAGMDLLAHMLAMWLAKRARAAAG
jgi:hypothetical protein